MDLDSTFGRRALVLQPTVGRKSRPGTTPTWCRRQRVGLQGGWQQFFHAPATTSRAPDGNAQEPAWRVHARSGDLVFHGAPRRHDERVRQGREVQQLSDVNRAYVVRL